MFFDFFLAPALTENSGNFQCRAGAECRLASCGPNTIIASANNSLHRFLRSARFLLFYVNVFTAVGVVLLATGATILNSLLLLLMQLVFFSSTHIRWRFLAGVLIGATARPICTGGRGRRVLLEQIQLLLLGLLIACPHQIRWPLLLLVFVLGTGMKQSWHGETRFFHGRRW